MAAAFLVRLNAPMAEDPIQEPLRQIIDSEIDAWLDIDDHFRDRLDGDEVFVKFAHGGGVRHLGHLAEVRRLSPRIARPVATLLSQFRLTTHPLTSP